MIDKKQIEQLLHVNGLHAQSDDSEIRAVLQASRYGDEEIIAVLDCLKQSGETSEKAIEGSGTNKLFRTGERLQPAEISQLLGVEVTVDEVILAEPDAVNVPVARLILLWLASVVIAAALVMGYMYTEKIGVFHPAMKTVSLE